MIPIVVSKTPIPDKRVDIPGMILPNLSINEMITTGPKITALQELKEHIVYVVLKIFDKFYRFIFTFNCHLVNNIYENIILELIELN